MWEGGSAVPEQLPGQDQMIPRRSGVEERRSDPRFLPSKSSYSPRWKEAKKPVLVAKRTSQMTSSPIFSFHSHVMHSFSLSTID